MSETEAESAPEEATEAVEPTASEGQHKEKVTFNEDQQQVFNSEINKKVAQTNEVRRESDKLKQEIEGLRKQIPVETRPDVPGTPDPYDDDYEARLKDRDAAIHKQAAYDAQETVRRDQEVTALQEQERVQVETLQKSVNEYSDRAIQLGVGEDDLRAAGNIVNQYGINPQLTLFILKDEQGPLITKYLSQNPQEIEALNRLDPMSAAVLVATSIKQKAVGLKPKSTEAPEPPEYLEGAGAPLTKRGPKGATFE